MASCAFACPCGNVPRAGSPHRAAKCLRNRTEFPHCGQQGPRAATGSTIGSHSHLFNRQGLIRNRKRSNLDLRRHEDCQMRCIGSKNKDSNSPMTDRCGAATQSDLVVYRARKSAWPIGKADAGWAA
jgi:hypothetical protein